MAIVHGPLLSKAACGKLKKAGYDVYFSKGQQIIRRWPRKGKQPNSAKQLAWRAAFKEFAAAYSALPQEAKMRWRLQAHQRKLRTGRALYLRARLKIWKLANPQWD